MEHATLPQHEAITPYNPELGVTNDVETLFAEMLYGSMSTEFTYTYNPEEDTLTAEDGRDIDTVFHKALEYSTKLADRNPNARFEKERNETELGELEDMHALMRGEFNTMVVVSDFPAELQHYPKDYLGYNVSRKQTMLRIFTREGTALRMRTQSLDQSYRPGLEGIYRALGTSSKPGQLLGQRLHFEMSEEQQTNLIGRLRDVYDGILSAMAGKKHFAGIEINENRVETNTYEFVKAQEDIVALATAETLTSKMTNEKLFSTVALLEERLEKYRNGVASEPAVMWQRISAGNVNPAQFALQITVLEEQRQRAGMLAKQQGKQFSACGVTVGGAGESVSALDQFKQAGFSFGDDGEVEDSSEDWDYDAEDYCIECQAPPEEGASKKKVGPCQICEDCVNKNHGGKK